MRFDLSKASSVLYHRYSDCWPAGILAVCLGLLLVGLATVQETVTSARVSAVIVGPAFLVSAGGLFAKARWAWLLLALTCAVCGCLLLYAQSYLFAIGILLWSSTSWGRFCRNEK